MDIGKTILAEWVCLLITAAPVLCGSIELASSKKNSVEAKIDVSDDGGKTVAVEMDAVEAKDAGTAEGDLQIRSQDNSETLVELVYMAVDDDYAWLAGRCTKDSGSLAGKWLFIAVHDGGQPGRLVDQIWLEWLSDGESAAKQKVDNREKPAESKSIESGEIVVSCYDDSK